MLTVYPMRIQVEDKVYSSVFSIIIKGVDRNRLSGYLPEPSDVINRYNNYKRRDSQEYSFLIFLLIAVIIFKQYYWMIWSVFVFVLVFIINMCVFKSKLVCIWHLKTFEQVYIIII